MENLVDYDFPSERKEEPVKKPSKQVKKPSKSPSEGKEEETKVPAGGDKTEDKEVKIPASGQECKNVYIPCSTDIKIFPEVFNCSPCLTQCEWDMMIYAFRIVSSFNYSGTTPPFTVYDPNVNLPTLPLITGAVGEPFPISTCFNPIENSDLYITTDDGGVSGSMVVILRITPANGQDIRPQEWWLNYSPATNVGPGLWSVRRLGIGKKCGPLEPQPFASNLRTQEVWFNRDYIDHSSANEQGLQLLRCEEACVPENFEEREAFFTLLNQAVLEVQYQWFYKDPEVIERKDGENINSTLSHRTFPHLHHHYENKNGNELFKNPLEFYHSRRYDRPNHRTAIFSGIPRTEQDLGMIFMTAPLVNRAIKEESFPISINDTTAPFEDKTLYTGVNYRFFADRNFYKQYGLTIDGVNSNLGATGQITDPTLDTPDDLLENYFIDFLNCPLLDTPDFRRFSYRIRKFVAAPMRPRTELSTYVIYVVHRLDTNHDFTQFDAAPGNSTLRHREYYYVIGKTSTSLTSFNGPSNVNGRDAEFNFNLHLRDILITRTDTNVTWTHQDSRTLSYNFFDPSFGSIFRKRVFKLGTSYDLLNWGLPDVPFSAGGNVGTNGTIYGSCVQRFAPSNQDRWVAVGNFSNANGIAANGIVRYLSNGTVDPSFNSGGGTFNSSLNTFGELRAIEQIDPIPGTVISSGGFIVVGSFFTYDDNPGDVCVVSVNGAFITSDNSVLSMPLVTKHCVDYIVRGTSPNNIIDIYVGGDLPFGIRKYNFDVMTGIITVDSTFETNIGTNINSNSSVFAVKVYDKTDPNSPIIIGGNFTEINGNTTIKNGLAVLNSDGTIRTSFNNSGGQIGFGDDGDAVYTIDIARDVDGNTAAGRTGYYPHVANWAPIESPILPPRGTNGLKEGLIIVGGKFREFNGSLVNNFAILNELNSTQPGGEGTIFNPWYLIYNDNAYLIPSGEIGFNDTVRHVKYMPIRLNPVTQGLSQGGPHPNEVRLIPRVAVSGDFTSVYSENLRYKMAVMMLCRSNSYDYPSEYNFPSIREVGGIDRRYSVGAHVISNFTKMPNLNGDKEIPSILTFDFKVIPQGGTHTPNPTDVYAPFIGGNFTEVYAFNGCNAQVNNLKQIRTQSSYRNGTSVRPKLLYGNQFNSCCSDDTNVAFGALKMHSIQNLNTNYHTYSIESAGASAHLDGNLPPEYSSSIAHEFIPNCVNTANLGNGFTFNSIYYNLLANIPSIQPPSIVPSFEWGPIVGTAIPLFRNYLSHRVESNNEYIVRNFYPNGQITTGTPSIQRILSPLKLILTGSKAFMETGWLFLNKKFFNATPPQGSFFRAPYTPTPPYPIPNPNPDNTNLSKLNLGLWSANRGVDVMELPKPIHRIGAVRNFSREEAQLTNLLGDLGILKRIHATVSMDQGDSNSQRNGSRLYTSNVEKYNTLLRETYNRLVLAFAANGWNEGFLHTPRTGNWSIFSGKTIRYNVLPLPEDVMSNTNPTLPYNVPEKILLFRGADNHLSYYVEGNFINDLEKSTIKRGNGRDSYDPSLPERIYLRVVHGIRFWTKPGHRAYILRWTKICPDDDSYYQNFLNTEYLVPPTLTRTYDYVSTVGLFNDGTAFNLSNVENYRYDFEPGLIPTIYNPYNTQQRAGYTNMGINILNRNRDCLPDLNNTIFYAPFVSYAIPHNETTNLYSPLTYITI